MIKKALWGFTFGIASVLCFGQTYTGPIPKPSSGYGSDGSFLMDQLDFTNPAYTLDDSRLFYPQGIAGRVPTIFFLHGFGAKNSSLYMCLIQFIVSKGYAVVFVPYPGNNPVTDNLDILKTGFSYAARNYTSIIDTTKVGFVGHSYGGGALFELGHYFFTNHKWGSSGRFLMPMAQWYSYEITQAELKDFPADTKLLSFIFEEDKVCDHRMAIEIFNNCNIPYEEKDIIYVKSEIIDGYTYQSDHNVCLTSSSYDALDYYVIYRLMDALMDYTFNGNIDAKETALGNGSKSQTSIPDIDPLVVSDNTAIWHDQSKYLSKCNSSLNPRSDYCGVSVLGTQDRLQTDKANVFIYPNPTNANLTVELENKIQSTYSLYNLYGKLIMSGTINQKAFKLDLLNLSQGIYLLQMDSKSYRVQKK